jgi:hypothetical protein
MAVGCLLGEMIALWLVTVLVSEEGDGVKLAVWGVPANGSADDQMLLLSASIFDLSLFCPCHAVAGFITAIDGRSVEFGNFAKAFHTFSPESIAADSDVVAFVFQYLGIL